MARRRWVRITVSTLAAVTGVTRVSLWLGGGGLGTYAGVGGLSPLGRELLEMDPDELPP